MKKNILWIIGSIAAVLLFVGAYLLYNSLSEEYVPENIVVSSSSESESAEEQDYSAPDFTVYDSNGKAVNLSDYFGKPIVLNFWASWCPPCKSEMPHFETAYKENTDVQFLMVNMTSGDTKADADAFIKDEGYTFPVLFDTDGDAAMTYGASSLPVTFFIDKNGDMVTYAVGMLSEENLKKGIGMIKE